MLPFNVSYLKITLRLNDRGSLPTSTTMKHWSEQSYIITKTATGVEVFCWDEIECSRGLQSFKGNFYSNSTEGKRKWFLLLLKTVHRSLQVSIHPAVISIVLQEPFGFHGNLWICWSMTCHATFTKSRDTAAVLITW